LVFNDITAKIDTITETKQDGFNGILLNYHFNIPENYIKYLGVKSINFNIDLIKNSEISIDNELNKFNINNNFNNFILNSDLQKQIFIPYYIFVNEANKYNLTINSNATANNLEVGKNSQNFYLDIQNNYKIEFEKINIKITDLNNFDSIYYKIKHGNILLTQSSKIAEIKTDELKFQSQINLNIKDDVFIELYAVDKYGLETLIQTDKLDLKQLIKKKSLKLKSNKLVKKSTLQIKL